MNNEETNKKVGIFPKIITWAITIVSLIWLVETNYEKEPLICLLGGIGGLLSIYSLESFQINIDAKFWIKKIVDKVINTTLKVKDIFEILHLKEYEEFCTSVKKYRFKQIDYDGGRKYSQFSFRYGKGKRQGFFYREKSILNYYGELDTHKITKTFFSYKSILKKGIKLIIEKLVKEKSIEFLKEDESGFQICRVYKYNLGDGILTEEEEKIYTINIYYEFCENKSDNQYSIDFKYELKRKENTEANRVATDKTN